MAGGEQLAVWEFAAEQVAAGNRVAMAALVEARGSAPGLVGSVLALSADGGPCGTVGGGPPESRMLTVCADLLAHRGAPTLVQWDHRLATPQASGLVCGGSGTYVAWVLDPGTAGLRQELASMASALRAGQNRWWQVNPDGWRALAIQTQTGLQRQSTGWVATQAAGPRGAVLLVGGGHIGLALSQLLCVCDFRVVVIEERTGVPTFTTNNHAHVRLNTDYEQLPAICQQYAIQYAVVATHGPDSDRRALAALLPTPLAYLGLLGSRAKVAALLGREHPEHVHAPAGLAIGSQTPAEIAVSVAAEIVSLRAFS